MGRTIQTFSIMNLSEYKEEKPHYLRRIVWTAVNATLFRILVGRQLRMARNIILRAFGAQIPLRSLVYSTCKIWAPLYRPSYADLQQSTGSNRRQYSYISGDFLMHCFTQYNRSMSFSYHCSHCSKRQGLGCSRCICGYGSNDWRRSCGWCTCRCI